MELIFDLAGGIIYYLYGAVVGILYPARSRQWARWQACGFALGLIAFVAFGLAVVIAWLTDGTPFVWPSVLIGLVSLTGYAIVGNVCRKFHEGNHATSETTPPGM